MPVYVDRLRVYPPSAYRGAGSQQARRIGEKHGHRWCHLLADTESELHFFAEQLGMRREWAQGDHYDLVPSRRKRALFLGAIEVGDAWAVAVRKAWRGNHEQRNEGTETTEGG